jgi:hypothetical protein
MQGIDWQRQLQDVLAGQEKVMAQAAVLLQYQQDQHQASLAQLRQAGAAVGEGSQSLARDVVKTIETQGRHALRDGLDDAVGHFRQQLDGSLAETRSVLSTLADNAARASTVQTSLVWKGLVALLIGSVLAVAGTWAYARAQLKQIERQRMEARYLEAFNRADVVLCGEDLCANIDPSVPAQGADRRYRPIRPR